MAMIVRGVPFVLAVLLASCASQPADSTEEAELLEIQALQRRAHLEKDADLLTSVFADDFISVSGGVISRPDREESRGRFQAYFDSVEFLAWDDITPPEIRVSADGSISHVLVHKHVHVRDISTGGERRTEFAWVETYERRQGEWRLTMVVSTDRPAEDL